jgi:hypothetical protein
VKESIRDVITGELSLEYLVGRIAEGWKVASIEWWREASEANAPMQSANLLNEHTALPYGFRITEDGLLQENPLEATVLLIMLEQIIKEKRIQEIAVELNLQGYYTRTGNPWSAADVFELLPRLIEAGPSLLKSAAWLERRHAQSAAGMTH